MCATQHHTFHHRKRGSTTTGCQHARTICGVVSRSCLKGKRYYTGRWTAGRDVWSPLFCAFARCGGRMPAQASSAGGGATHVPNARAWDAARFPTTELKRDIGKGTINRCCCWCCCTADVLHTKSKVFSNATYVLVRVSFPLLVGLEGVQLVFLHGVEENVPQQLPHAHRLVVAVDLVQQRASPESKVVQSTTCVELAGLSRMDSEECSRVNTDTPQTRLAVVRQRYISAFVAYGTQQVPPFDTHS